MEAQKLNIFLHLFRRSIQSDVKWSKIGVLWRIWPLRDGLNNYKSVAKISFARSESHFWGFFLKKKNTNKNTVKKKAKKKKIENNNNNNNNLNWSEDSFLQKL